MPGLFQSLSSASSALAVFQTGLQVTGQNIANVGNPNYTRQSGRLTALTGGPVFGNITPGAGFVNQPRRCAADIVQRIDQRLCKGAAGQHHALCVEDCAACLDSPSARHRRQRDNDIVD